ncbi:uncharacterized protein EAE97_008045 [Botrytis byssoidea]|uniref:Uncharacterized protein n=1 Tax=Botrytis byssoidea TaxID=139641 RepID=A0A9P5IFM2_9HELO|nr:uncharacterized protein EAE97_008045 [Botrytis byssoidea]KAF7936679.1 hypothetical protein EAE97_008045 [Botrytis byssoidea]
MMNTTVSRLKRKRTDARYKAQIVQFYTLTYPDFRQRKKSRLSSEQLENNLVSGEAAVDEEGSSNGSTVTAKTQIQECATTELSIVEGAPTEIINRILNTFLEQEFPDIFSALCFGLTSRRNWAILRNLDHTSYFKEHMDQIPSIIDFKYDQIPLFNPYCEQAESNSVDDESNRNEYTFKHVSFNRCWPRFLKGPVIVRSSLNPSQRQQLILSKEWMGPKYRPPTSLLIPSYLSCAVYGELNEESIEEEILEDRLYHFIMYQAMKVNIPSPFGLGDVWEAVDMTRVSYQNRPGSTMHLFTVLGQETAEG